MYPLLLISHLCKRQLLKHFIEKCVCDQNIKRRQGHLFLSIFDKISFRKSYGTQLVSRTKVPVCNWTVSSDAVVGSTLLKITGFDTRRGVLRCVRNLTRHLLSRPVDFHFVLSRSAVVSPIVQISITLRLRGGRNVR